MSEMQSYQVLTSDEAAQFLRCNTNSLRDPTWRRRAGLHAVRIGRSLRFLKSDLVKFLESRHEVFDDELKKPPG